MGKGKAVGTDDIPVELWKMLGAEGADWLARLFNVILRTRKMPDEWRTSTLVPLYKNKGDILDCNNYRGIKLLSHTMKIWERVVERRLRKEVAISTNQFGFMPGRSTIEAIHLIRRTIELYRDRQKDLHMVFIDLEKAYDRVPREVLWRCLQAKGLSETYIQIIQDMYEGNRTIVKTPGGDTEGLPISIGLHRGSALSPFLFVLVMDELTRHIQEDVPWCMLFADDIVLVDESRQGINKKLELWRDTLEPKGLRISRNKTEYVHCRFSTTNTGEADEGGVFLGNEGIQQKESFKYLGSILQADGDIDKDIAHRIQAGWTKWRSASGVLCDKKISLALKGKFYKRAVRLALLYRA